MEIKKILRKIKKYEEIVIARHIGADPDALGSSIGLKETIELNFPNKKVYVVGNTVSRFKYLGELDKIPEECKEMLLIVTDTPDKKRIELAKPEYFKEIIKIDHHPFVEVFADLEWIDNKASSASQMIIEFIKENKLKINKSIAEKLFSGLVADTGRFLYDYTSPKTFDLTSWLIKKTDLNFTSLYPRMYLRNFNDIKFSAYITMNLTITKNGLAYLKLTDEMLKEYNVDPSTAGNLINNFNLINEFKVIALYSEDKINNYIKCSIRSRGPVINTTAAKYNGGGHALASGAKLNSFEEVDFMIEDLEKLCLEYNVEEKKCMEELSN